MVLEIQKNKIQKIERGGVSFLQDPSMAGLIIDKLLLKIVPGLNMD